ncbi:MAG TPA: dihydrofolate reductase family protein [Solirubrobacteraceae bacterium]|nr:dihydrofolate reductase family protein [Solirubrobacteraceae bacterium]
MGELILDITISLDGFIAGPNRTLEEPLGEGGGRLHEWAFATKSARERHGLTGGETNVDHQLVEESVRNTAATVMGRRMFSGGEGGWAEDPNANGWWGDEPPFHHPVFVLTQHAREALSMQGGTTFTFVTDGIEAALEQARAVAGEHRDVAIGGGASVAQQYLAAGLLDRLQLHVAPVLLGDGVRLFDGNLAQAPGELQCTSVIESPAGVAHLGYRVVR